MAAGKWSRLKFPSEGDGAGGKFTHAEVQIGYRATVDDKSEEFLTRLKEGLTAALEEMAEDGERLSAEMAPVGHKQRDPRTARISESFYRRVEPGFSRGLPRDDELVATWGNTARHALVQERGGKPHPITADVTFFWEKYGRKWIKPPPDSGQKIHHPGNPAHPFLRPAFEIIWASRNDYFKRHVRLK